jgi:FkbM family methyltransferase
MTPVEPTRLRAARLICSRLQPFGARRLARSLYPYELGQQDRYEFSVRAKTGSTFTGNTADFHAHPFAVNGCSEWRNWAVALAVCRPGELIVEIGANVGTETVGFSDIVSSSGRVVAFEPLPTHIERLERALEGLRHDNVTLMPYALSDHEGRDTFAVPPPSMSQGIGHLAGPEELRTGSASYYDKPVEMELTEVQTRPLDDFRAQLSGLRLVVADAEGSELPILRGARRLIAEQRPILVLEASQPHQRRAGFDIAQLHDELMDLSYTAYDIEHLSLTEVKDPAAGPAHGDWLCLPERDDKLVARVQRVVRRCALSPCVLGLNPLTSPRRR